MKTYKGTYHKMKLHHITEYHSGDLVICDYVDFDGNYKSGIFVVLYDELVDGNTSSNLNITAVKVTTKCQGDYNYYVQLDKGVCELNRTCRVCCSKVYTFHKKQCTKKIGHLTKNIMSDILFVYGKYYEEINRQMGG